MLSNKTESLKTGGDLIKEWFPLILSGTSLCISLYTLFKCIPNATHVISPSSNVMRSSKSRIDKHVPKLQTSDNVSFLSRVMLPHDANSSGNVHGGTILKMIGHAGWLAATKYINAHLYQQNNTESSVEEEKYISSAIMVRMGEMNFEQPMYIGEICICKAWVTFTSEKSIEVQVTVFGENAILGKKRKTNTARLWFVSIRIPSVIPNASEFELDRKMVERVPALTTLSEDEHKSASIRYKEQKSKRLASSDIGTLREWMNRLLQAESYDKERHSPTVFQLTNVTLPGDCFGHESIFVDGGYCMKLMDNTAACVAFAWAASRIVTVRIEAIDFVHTVKCGMVIHCYSRLVFTSRKSMEILVIAFINDKIRNLKKIGSENNGKKIAFEDMTIVCKAYFTFVALSMDKNAKSLTKEIPQFVPFTEFEIQLFQDAKDRYQKRKEKRLRAQNTN